MYLKSKIQVSFCQFSYSGIDLKDQVRQMKSRIEELEQKGTKLLLKFHFTIKLVTRKFKAELKPKILIKLFLFRKEHDEHSKNKDQRAQPVSKFKSDL